ncbi:MAG: M20 family metallopeptidase [Candidatus Binataceae bacterium]|nr:M20 family metallopeptidase [Candidatus Binataceae bacterium]
MDAKAGARERFASAEPGLIALSHRIHAFPELGFEEERAAQWLCETMADAGFTVDRGVCGMPTAFIARAGSGPLHLAICAEYDCLPGIGHACGHNVIAALGAGAAMAIAKVADEAGLTISLFGTPAEELCNGGGKILLLEGGAFAGIHAAMMVHPAPIDMAAPTMIAAAMFDVHYTGKEAHASAFPELGINAADALTVAQTSIGLLRQHIRDSDRIHGIVTKGGEAANIVPAHTAARYMVRAQTLGLLDDLLPRVHRCLEAGAIATGCTYEIVGGDKPYAEMRHDRAIASLYRRNAIALGRSFVDPDPTEPHRGGAPRVIGAGSTDMGNVSLKVPAIHPLIGINSIPAVNHQPEFTARCATPDADRAIADGAIAMAWTAIDIAGDEALRKRLMSDG